mgnify:FL=1
MCVEVILEFLKFPAELIIAEAAFLIDRERKERFALRAPAALAVYFILSVGWSILIEAIAVDSFFPYVLLYLGYAALSLLPVWFCFELDMRQSIWSLL